MEFVDWFKNDEDAEREYRKMMEDDGYIVNSVDIGHPCVIEVDLP